MYYVGLLQENWETRCGYVYAVTITNMVKCYRGPTSIKTKDHADQLWCVVPTPQTLGVEPILFYCWVNVVDGGSTLKQH